MFKRSETGIILNIIFLLLLLSLLTSLLIAVGKENVAIVIKRENVGVIREYNPTPSIPIVLVIIILNMKPKNLDKNPPVKRIKVPKTNLLFIIFFIILNIMNSI